MRVVYAIDEMAKVAFINSFPACRRWAQERTQATGRPIKVVCCRGGEKTGRTIAEVTGEGIRLLKSGTLWRRKSLESLYVEH